MANYNVTTKIFVVNSQDTRADSVAGSTAKEITDYLETIDDAKTIRAFFGVALGNGMTQVTLVHNS